MTKTEGQGKSEGMWGPKGHFLQLMELTFYLERICNRETYGKQEGTVAKGSGKQETSIRAVPDQT